MAKKYKNKGFAGKLAAVIGMIVGLIASIGVGGLFATGAMLNVPILEVLPEVVHTFVGWIIIVGSLLSGVLYLFGKK